MSKTWHRKRSWDDEYDFDHESSGSRHDLAGAAKKQRIREERMRKRQLQREEKDDNSSYFEHKSHRLGRWI